MKKNNIAFLVLLSLIVFPVSSHAQVMPQLLGAQDAQARLDMMEKDMDRIGQAPVNFGGPRLAPEISDLSVRRDSMETTLRNIAIEISLEYQIVDGEQTFEIIDEVDGSKVSQLHYPIRGEIPIVKGEIAFRRKISIGGSYATSNLRKRNCSDEDWNFIAMHNGALKFIDYQIINQDSKSRLEFYDLNLYYNLFNSAEDNPGDISLDKKRAYKNLLADSLVFDVFGGYQSFKGRYRMIDPVTSTYRLVDGAWWYDSTLPADLGLNSFYKIEYKGPRLGLRLAGSKGKLASKISLSEAWLRTKAYGYWNLRDYSFWQTGKSGLGTTLELEATYALTPSWSCGVGYDYSAFYQKKLKESGVQPAGTYNGLDIVRNANAKIYGPKILIKYIW